MPAPSYAGGPARQFGGVPMAPSSPSSGNAGISPPSYPGAGHASGSVAAQPPLNFPALHLHPLNDSFAPKQISLAPPGPNNRVKIGRQTNAKTVPNPSNGYFDSKVLSRMHAEVWSQDGKVYIKDVKSSNGTFINSERLSAEGVESDVFELHSEDLVEFGIDIVGDDNKTIIHHKVACRVFLVLTAEDAMSLRADFAALYRGGGHGGPMGGAGMGPGAEGGLRRGKSTMSFDHILSRLQSELQKSRETGAELGTLAGAIGEVGETLGGGLAPMQNPPYQHQVPPDPSEAAAAMASAAQSATVAALQEQLASTQASLASHVEKMHALEGLLAEHETMRSEVGSMKAEMEKAKRDIDEMNLAALSAKSHSRAANGTNDEEQDFDDGASIASMDTVMAGDASAPSAKSSDSSRDEPAADEDALRQLNHVGPPAPPDEPPVEESSAVPAAVAAALAAQNEALSARLAALEVQLEEALAIGRNLQAEHAGATEAVRALEGRMATLEKEVSETSARAEGAAVRALEGRFVEWRSTLESAWSRERQAWDAERDELKRVVKAWDEANGWLENEAAKAASANEVNGIASASSPNPSASGKRRGSKSAKRRAARRHLNPSLRALLYHSSHADVGPHDDDELSDADEASQGAVSGLGMTGADRAADSTSEPGRSDGSAERTDSTAATSPSGSVAALTKASVPPPLAGGPQHGSTRGSMENTSLPMMGAAGVVALGMAAWILSGKAAPKLS